MSDQKLKKIKSGFLNRSLSMTKVALQSGASIAANSFKNVLADKDTKKSSFKALLEVQAHRLAKELGQLKGSLMKVGQMLALYGEHFFPEEVVNALKSLNESSPPLKWEAVEPIINKRLKLDQRSALEIDTEALAAASMGQVHMAKVKETGEVVCVKVQYPGVVEAIDSDIKTLRSLLSMFKVLPSHNEGFELLFKEISTVLKQEMDYARELRCTDQMSEMLAGQQDYIIPKTYPQFSGPKIITTSYEQGVNIDSHEVARLSEKRRSHLGLAFARLFLNELFTYHHVQTDPHFGNYKIRLNESEPDQIVLLDFGAVRKFSKPFVDNYRTLLTGAMLNDREMCIRGAMEVGFLRDSDGPELLNCFMDLACLAVEPWLPLDDPRVNHELLDENNHYRWGESELPNRITKKATEYALTFKLRPPPREVVFLDRKIGGVFIILKTLDARFDAWSLIKPHLSSS